MDNMNTLLHPNPTPNPNAARQQWMYALAHARRAELEIFETQLKEAPYQIIRAPETGMAMVRGRMGASGAPFNVGEMTVTRCVVKNAENCTGYSYVAGRDKKHAELAALADACLQTRCPPAWLNGMIKTLNTQRQLRRIAREKETASTQVKFFTLVRGENDA